MKQNETKQKALRLARRYLQTTGLNGFSFQNIADQLGIRKASLHYYFSSKDELTTELLTGYTESFKKWAELQELVTADHKIKSMIQLFTEMAAKEQRICPTGALCADFNSLSRANKVELQKMHQTQRQWIVETIRQGIKEKSLSKNLSASETADMFMAIIQGGLQIARLRGDSSLAKRIMTDFYHSIQS